jgi:hypothetical protein
MRERSVVRALWTEKRTEKRPTQRHAGSLSGAAHRPGHGLNIQLHAFDTPNARKISVALEEMALPYDVQVVDITRDEQFDPAFLRISPNNKIPAIVDPNGPGGKPISVFESGAILIYLGEKTGKFWPGDPVARVAASGQWPGRCITSSP